MSREGETGVRPGSTEKRAAIERAALTCFLRDGFARTGVDAVAAAAGVSKRTVYDYYGSKERLFLDVLERTFAGHEARFVELLERTLCAPVTALDQLERALVSFGREFASGTGQTAERSAIVGLVMAEAPHFPELAARWRATGPQQSALAGRLRELADAGLLDVDDPVEAAMHLGNLVSTPVQQRTLNGAEPIAEDELLRIVRSGVRVFLRAYGSRPAENRCEPAVHTVYVDPMNHELTQSTVVADPGPKLDDRPDEQARRHRALAAVRAALDAEADVAAQAGAASASRAQTATWLGASLADLAAVTGHSRQAARKRWPMLGPIARRRRWLGYHVDDLLWAADLVVRHADAFPPAATDGLADEVAALRAAFAAVPDGADDLAASAGPAGTTAGADADPATRWRMLDDLVDRRLRAAGEAAVSESDDVEFARAAAEGVVGYYDHATRRDEGDDDSDR